MTGKFILDRYNGKFTWVDELAYRGERNAAKRAIQNELAN